MPLGRDGYPDGEYIAKIQEIMPITKLGKRFVLWVFKLVYHFDTQLIAGNHYCAFIYHQISNSTAVPQQISDYADINIFLEALGQPKIKKEEISPKNLLPISPAVLDSYCVISVFDGDVVDIIPA